MSAANVKLTEAAKIRLNNRKYDCQIVRSEQVDGYWNVIIRLDKSHELNTSS
jgi:hypothetical protein